jgi:hypothetical protein
MRHPLESVPVNKRRPLFALLLILTLIVMGVLQSVDGSLRNEVAPQGIVSFELAGDVAATRAILDSWGSQARAHAGFSLGFDFLFLALYSTTIACACAWISSALRDSVRPLALLGLLLAWGQWLAALLDATENTALLITLLDVPASPWPQIAQGCATVKFALVLLGLFYVILGGIWAIKKR